MKLPLLENLKTVRVNRVSTTPRSVISREAEPLGSFTVIPTRYAFKTSAEFHFRQEANEDAPMDVLHSQATRAIMRDVYGPVFNELLSIREKLWEEGYTGEAAEKIEGLLAALSAK